MILKKFPRGIFVIFMFHILVCEVLASTNLARIKLNLKQHREKVLRRTDEIKRKQNTYYVNLHI